MKIRFVIDPSESEPTFVSKKGEKLKEKGQAEERIDTSDGGRGKIIGESGAQPNTLRGRSISTKREKNTQNERDRELAKARERTELEMTPDSA